MIGASLDGTVTEVRGDVVRVSLRTDAKSGAGKWFSFSTVYSSPDGSGWYCMPEPGDEIRLYFPTEQEKHGYVISAVHLPVTQPQAGAAVAAADTQNPSAGQAAFGKQGKAKKNPGARRSDPMHKTICTSSNKMVDLSEHSIILDAGNGMSVVLDDEYGISIVSPKGVYIQSDACIDISSLNDRVEICGATSVNIAQEDSSIEVKESNVIYHGANAGDCSWGAAPDWRTWDREDNEIFHVGISGRACKGRACRDCRNAGERCGGASRTDQELLGGTVCRGNGAGDLQRDCTAGTIAGGKRLSPASFGAWQRESVDGYGEGKADISGYIHDLRAGDHQDRIRGWDDGGVSPPAG